MMIKRCFLYIRAFSKEKSQLFNIFYEFLTYSHNYTNTHTTVYHPFSPKQPLFFLTSFTEAPDSLRLPPAPPFPIYFLYISYIYLISKYKNDIGYI